MTSRLSIGGGKLWPVYSSMAKLTSLGANCVFVLSAVASAFAQTTASDTRASEPAQTTAAEQAQLAQKFVDEKLAVWRQRLQLEDWRISAVMTPRGDLASKTLGGIRWDKTKKSAVIYVLDPSDYRLAFREMLDDMELTIVHELVHLDLATAPHREASRSVEEHAVNGIAEAMLALDRKKQ
jgi:hypothetical protein